MMKAFILLNFFLTHWLGLGLVRCAPINTPRDNTPDDGDGDDDRLPISFYTIEEHWASPALIGLFAANPLIPISGTDALLPILAEVGPKRIASMDANNISVQVVSHIPAASEAMFMSNATSLANQQLADHVAAFPNRFRGFCVLPMALPSDAAAQFEECVTKYKFVGALVDALVVQPDGGLGFFEGPEYDLLWAVAVKYNVPIYLHPTYPPLDDILSAGQGKLYAPMVPGGYSDQHAVSLGTLAWGWHERTALSFLRLYLGGVFNRFPRLQIVLGHMGEMLPYYLWRADKYLSINQTVRLREVYDNNVYVTTSGIFSLEPMETLLNVTNTSRVIYSVDWPFAKNEDGKAFMQTLRTSGLVSESQFEDIAFGNAKRLLQLGGNDN
jgi:predicted TIM-barrel fold metal-dependent hydrolase